MPADYTLTYACPDTIGLVRAVANWLFRHDCNIIDSDQFGDPDTQRFFMRVHFSGNVNESTLRGSFDEVARPFAMDWQIWANDQPSRAMIMVSRQDHCLRDLLYRVKLGEIPLEVPLVVSNHPDVAQLVAAEGIDFLHLPVTQDSKPAQEHELTLQLQNYRIDFIVLARYMQILSPEFCNNTTQNIINIHHSFLPGFKGAKPYHQAHERGVKLIGATAHYVTADLDEGPIIEQDVQRVDHRASPEELTAIGRDIERQVLARAVKMEAEHRILRNGSRTVVFQ